MRLFWTGLFRGWFTKNNKSSGYILLPEVLIAMLVVAFCMAQLWQTVFGAMSFGSRIETEFVWNSDFSKICTRVYNSASALDELFGKKQQLRAPVDQDKKNDFLVTIELGDKKSELYKIAGTRFAYLVVKNNKNKILQLPIFMGPEEKGQKDLAGVAKDKVVPIDKLEKPSSKDGA